MGIIPGKIDWSLNRQWLDILSVSGSPLFISVKPDDITDSMKDDIKKAFFRNSEQKDIAEPLSLSAAVEQEPIVLSDDIPPEKKIKILEKQMKQAASELEFEIAAQIRDEIAAIKKQLEEDDE